MSAEMQMLIFAAITVASLHTLAGPDHYLPFIALAKSRKWTFAQTLLWTAVCGCGHVGSSVVLGIGGAALGWSLSKITWLQGIRGGVAGWALLGFGIVYGLWGCIKARQQKAHKHFDIYEDGSVYVYEHKHDGAVLPQDRHAVTPWVMFIIFLLGPCEPMIPLLYFPVAKSSWWSITLLIAVYMFFTLAVMLLMVTLGYFGISFLKTEKLERYMQALGGLTLFLCGAGMVFMDW